MITTREQKDRYRNFCTDILGMTDEQADAATAAWAHPLKEYTYGDFMDEPDMGWLVGDNDHPILLANAIWMDYGPEKSGKTYRDLELAFCIAFGLDYYGWKVQQGNVAYVITEGSMRRIFKRVHALYEKYRAPLEALGYRTFQEVIDAGKFNLIGSPINLIDPKAVNGIDQLIEQMKHPPYVGLWLDTWSRMLAASGGHSSDMETVPLALQGCDVLHGKLGTCSIILIAHTPLSDKGRPKGLNEQTGNIDGATRCEKISVKGQEIFKFTSDFQRHATNDFSMVFKQVARDPDRIFINEDGEFADSALKDKPVLKQALDILRQMPAGITVTEWRACCKEKGLMTGKNPRQQWAEIKSGLLAVNAVDIDSATKVATARTPKAE